MRTPLFELFSEIDGYKHLLSANYHDLLSSFFTSATITPAYQVTSNHIFSHTNHQEPEVNAWLTYLVDVHEAMQLVGGDT